MLEHASLGGFPIIGGVLHSGGFSILGEGVLHSWGGSPFGGSPFLGVGFLHSWGGFSILGGMGLLLRGEGVSHHALRQTPPPH